MPAKPSPVIRGTGARAGRLAMRALLGAAVLLALLAAGHALLWFWLGNRLEEGFAAWAAARRAQGWQVEHGPPQRGGWPFAATLALPQFRLEGAAATWQAESLVLRLSPPRLDRLGLEARGRQSLRLGLVDFPFTAGRLTASLPIENSTLPSEAVVQAELLRVGTPAGEAGIGDARLEFHSRLTAAKGEPALALRLAANQVALPPALAEASPIVAQLGPSLDRLAADLSLTGPLPPGGNPARSAAAWRDGGGTLELHSLDLRWGRVSAAAMATMTLDEGLQPMGAGTLRLAGGGEVLDAAASAGLLTPRAATTARTVLALLSRTPPEGGPPRIEVPLSLEDRVLALGGFPLAQLPRWTWPAPSGAGRN